MKKKILLLIFTFVLLIPSFVLAAGCANCGGTGSGGGTGNGRSNTGGTCDLGNCTKGSTGGVRLTLYSYKGSGTPQKIGDGVDIWAKNYYTPYIVTSPADSDVLKDRKSSSCKVGHGGYSLSGYDTYSWSEYKKVSTYYVEDIASKIRNGNIADWLYNVKTGTGWLKTKLFDPMKNGELDKVAELFNTTEAVISNNSEHLYIVAELITQIILQPGSDKVYSGTVSEISTNVIFNEFINGMYINNSYYDKLVNETGHKKPFGELVSKSGGNSYLKAASGNGFYPNNTGKYRFITGASGELCGRPYGMAVWYLAICCPECVKSCETTCKNFGTGTSERNACAIEYCNLEEPGNSTCVSSCVTTDEDFDEGCSENNKNKCAFTKSPVAGASCPGANVTDELSSTICYDDTVTLSVPGETSDNKDLLRYKYYKIECNEKMNISNVSSNIKVLQFENRSADLHLGLTVEYSKSCELFFKKKDKSWQKANNNDGDTLIKQDMSLYKSYMEKYKNTNATLYDIYSKNYNALVSAYNRAYSRLDYVTGLDTLDVDGNADISIVNKGLTDVYEAEIVLKPIYCESGDSDVSNTMDESLKCVLKKDKVNIQDDNSVVCGDDENIVINKNSGTGSYEYTVHYASESTWVSSYDDPNHIYFGEDRGGADCLTAVKAFNGYCTEVANVYRFEPFAVSVKNTTEAKVTSGDYTINIQNYGSCGQFDYSCKSKYSLIDGQACLKCMDYNPTSEEYLNCYKQFCSCEVICGSNVACRAKYCPLECPGCEVGFTDITSTEDSCDDCINSCNDDFPNSGAGGTNENLLSNISCRYDCCNSDCDKSNDTCRYDCCITKCDTLRDKNLLTYAGYEDTAAATALQACYNYCKCPNGDCGGDYYYRTINQSKPFPERTPGANWFNKEEYITQSHNQMGIYYDKTDGKSAEYEYKITLSSDDIQKIKNNDKLNTTYIQKKSSTSIVNKDDKGVYCSYVLHEFLNDELNIKIEEGSDGKYGSGCSYIG